MSSRNLKPYIKAHVIIVPTSYLLRQVLHKPETTSHLIKWAIEIGQYEIRYQLRTARKAQAIADSIAKFTSSSKSKEKLEAPVDDLRPSLAPSWFLQVDGSSNEHGCGVGLLLTSPLPKCI